ncbi:alpha/beta hydrolase [Levilactobacillus fujinensis]|uniref:Alpha/beta hydrolase n=1 Tax=Levilactobacillus fujinensis TaxID=2486024 RepID=A0ABW1TEH9_9LACO|nr:alpha/beta hydrolase [Levilactobacillus fujinensis]
MIKKWHVAVTLGLSSWLGVRWVTRPGRPEPLVTQRPDVHYAAIPTLFIPGWGGGAITYNGMLRWFARHGYGHKIATIRVDWAGRRHFSGSWDSQATNPLIQVLFDHSLTRDYQPQIQWITAILRDLYRQYGVRQYNLVGHSWGGSAAVNSLVLHGPSPDIPRLNRLVLLGAPVDEGTAQHPVDATFERLRAARHQLRANEQAQLFNVYGTLPGRHTDGSVPVQQVTALRQIVADSAIRYDEHHIAGLGHGRLHSARQMYQLVAQLLWVN